MEAALAQKESDYASQLGQLETKLSEAEAQAQALRQQGQLKADEHQATLTQLEVASAEEAKMWQDSFDEDLAAKDAELSANSAELSRLRSMLEQLMGSMESQGASASAATSQLGQLQAKLAEQVRAESRAAPLLGQVGSLAHRQRALADWVHRLKR